MSALHDHIKRLITPYLTEHNFILCDIKIDGAINEPIIQVYIDKDTEYITIEDCVRTARFFNDLFSLEAKIPAAFRLEVSSPGVNFPLTEIWQFIKNEGRRIKLKSERKVYEGIIQDVAEDGTVSLQEDDQLAEYPIRELAGAKIVLDVGNQKMKSKRKRHEA